MWYWATTTLASVGYGDIRPISNSERLVTGLIFLIGVAAFSFIMGNFIDMLMEFRNVTAENEQHGGLTKFLGLLSRFNKGYSLQKSMSRRIEEYFDYYWAKDLNYAMKSEEDQRFLSELPKEIRVAIYKDFLFHNFIYKFRFYFTIKKSEAQVKNLVGSVANQKMIKGNYEWTDRSYCSFMIRFLQQLEPRNFKKDETILHDLEEVEEILFVVKGDYKIGYTLNNVEHYALRLHERTVIGDISVMFRRRSEFMYKALSEIDC
jgi:potassium voltage-gated channel Eag-related subfamily H protein 8